MEEERLQKYLANQGIGSRRKCEQYILEGKVTVNGKTIKELGTKINPEKDEICYNGKKVNKQEKKVYILLNKPIGYVTTVKDQFNRDTVMDLIKIKERIVPVGRLDMYTSGALILTNDGNFVYKCTHPKHEITKTYTVTLKGIITKEEVEQLKKGVDIGGYTTRPAKIKILKTDQEKDISRLEIIIHEGKNRQVRKMCEAVLPEKWNNLFDKKIILNVVDTGVETNILNKKIEFFDINAKKVKQTGFMMWINENDKFTFIGDETCSETTKKYVKNSKWLFADAYMAGKEAEEYDPIQRHHHSTVKFVAELCMELNVENVIMSHTVDTDLKNRKKVFSEDAYKYYNGNVFVPDDLEVIEIK